MEQKNQNKFVDLKIIAFEKGRTNSHNPQEDTCHSHSMCYKTPVRFKVSLREIFFKSGSLRVMEKQYESALTMILQEFGSL